MSLKGRLLYAGLATLVIAHGSDHHDGGMSMSGNMSETAGHNMTSGHADFPPNYFGYPDHRFSIYSHIALMTLSWVIALPTAVMLSLARSRYTLAAQISFLATHFVGLALGIVYNTNTPDLYPNNAHHKIGWIVTVVVTVHVSLSLAKRATGTSWAKRTTSRSYQELRSFIPITRFSLDTHQTLNASPYQPANRSSYDSGHGTDRATESLRSNSISTVTDGDIASPTEERRRLQDDSFDDEPLTSHPHQGRWAQYGSKFSIRTHIRGAAALRVWYNVVDRIILPFGFVAICTGIVTYGRFFEGSAIFSGLAHWIKGGVFFWLGILTLGRWSGCFGELGWAWNVRSKNMDQKWRPTAEFVESFLIFFYGSTNIFLEHLGGWGGEWTAQDLEHLSITVLFIGGGLCGMLIESTKIRDLLNTTASDASNAIDAEVEYEEYAKEQALDTPDNYGISLNPIPALVIFLLGIMMSSHTQESMISSMVHKQWGNLLTGASFARGLTYVVMYLKPPRSVLPSRPPTELLASFGLIAGGIIFMASASDTVLGMENYQLDAMFMYTVTMGLVGLLMAWVLFLLALKGWAVRREAARKGRPQRVSPAMQA
ncbi:hypothetical protein jhhlp_002631 [Lomentospora prolificans]|uniref:Protein YTP1-like C-terminal domain-containing protein n=1 Tax=Lomentospora prolificans TaxID=41688 RepID=A0A2N3NEL8_9PEZI|nr:hypothetical protein jhhlp_002631 [Lomentospora prolificans]